MLLEEIKRHQSGDALVACTNCKLALVLVIEASSCILVDLKIVNGGLKEAVKSHEYWEDIMDD